MLDLFLNWTIDVCTPVIAPWVFTSFDHFLPIFAPVVAVIGWFVDCNRCLLDPVVVGLRFKGSMSWHLLELREVVVERRGGIVLRLREKLELRIGRLW